MSSAKPTEVLSVDPLEMVGRLQSEDGILDPDRIPLGVDASFQVRRVIPTTQKHKFEPVEREHRPVSDTDLKMLRIDRTHFLGSPVATVAVRKTIRTTDAESHLTVEMPADPENVIDEVPLELLGGYGASKQSMVWLRRFIASHGLKVATLDQPRSRKWWKSLDMRHVFDAGLLYVQTGTAALHALQDIAGSDMIDAAGHSWGGATLGRIAERQSKVLRNGVWIGSAGLYHHGFLETLWNGATDGREELQDSLPDLWERFEPQLAITEGHYFLRSIIRAGREGHAAATAYVVSEIEQARKDGVITAVAAFQNDPLFGIQKVAASAAGVVDVFSSYPVPEAGHIEPIRNPERFGAYLMDLMGRMNELRQRKSAAS